MAVECALKIMFNCIFCPSYVLRVCFFLSVPDCFFCCVIQSKYWQILSENIFFKIIISKTHVENSFAVVKEALKGQSNEIFDPQFFIILACL